MDSVNILSKLIVSKLLEDKCLGKKDGGVDFFFFFNVEQRLEGGQDTSCTVTCLTRGIVLSCLLTLPP